MADRANRTMIEWLDINLDQLSSDDRMTLCEEVMDTMSASELMSMREFAEEKRKGKLDEAKNQVLAEMREKLAELGVNPDDIAVSIGVRRRQRKSNLPPKYRSPDGTQTWSGRGQKAAWLKDLEAKGHDIQEFLIKEE